MVIDWALGNVSRLCINYAWTIDRYSKDAAKSEKNGVLMLNSKGTYCPQSVFCLRSDIIILSGPFVNQMCIGFTTKIPTKANVLFYLKCICELDHMTFTWRKRPLRPNIPSQQKAPKLFGYVLVDQEPKYKRSLESLETALHGPA